MKISNQYRHLARCFACAIIIALAACAIPPASGTPTAVTDPETAILYAAATSTAAYNSMSATETAQANIYATDTAIAVKIEQAINAAKAEEAQAQAVESTSIAARTETLESLEIEITRSAMHINETRETIYSNATATAVNQQAQADAERNERRGQWATVGMGGLGIILFSIAVFGFAHARRIWRQANVVQDRNGDVVALASGRGYEILLPDETPPALPPTDRQPEYDADRQIRVNGQPVQLWRPPVIVEYEGESYEFNGRQLDMLCDWYDRGDETIRRDTSGEGPGWEEIGIGSGSLYGRVIKILQGRGYVTREQPYTWTALGRHDFLGL